MGRKILFVILELPANVWSMLSITNNIYVTFCSVLNVSKHSALKLRLLRRHFAISINLLTQIITFCSIFDKKLTSSNTDNIVLCKWLVYLI